VSGHPWTTDQRELAHAMKAEGVLHSEIAKQVGRSVQSVTSMFHDIKVLGAAKPKKQRADRKPWSEGSGKPRHNIVTEMMRRRVLERVKDGVARKMIAAQMLISTSTVDNIIWRAQRDGEVSAIAPKGRWEKPADPIMSRARQLVATRLIKQRIGMDHIAEALSRDFPGPVVMPSDVVTFARGLAA
jgi:transposase